MKNSLELKVLSINTLYEFAQKCINYEMNHFRQFLGKDIFKVDGSVKAKYDHEKTSFDGSLADGTHFHVHYWFTSSYNSFDIHIKSCINGGTYDVRPSTAFTIYEETTFTMFQVKDGLLVENTEWYNTDYSIVFDAETIRKQSETINELAEEYNRQVNTFPHHFKEVCNVKRLRY